MGELVHEIVAVLYRLAFRVGDFQQFPASGVILQGGGPIQWVLDRYQFILSIITKSQGAATGVSYGGQAAIDIVQGDGLSISVYDARQAIDRSPNHERGVRNRGKMEDSLVLLGKGKSPVEVLHQDFKVAGSGSVDSTCPPFILDNSTVPIHKEHVAALAEQKDVVGMGPAITHDSVDLCPGIIGVIAVVAQGKINGGTSGALDAGDIILLPEVSLGDADGAATWDILATVVALTAGRIRAFVFCLNKTRGSQQENGQAHEKKDHRQHTRFPPHFLLFLSQTSSPGKARKEA